MHRASWTLCVCLPTLLLTAAPLRADEAPEWLAQASRLPARSFDAKVPAEVLVDEGLWEVDGRGRITATQWHAIRVLTREGRDYAVASVPYSTDSDKVRDLKAWVIDGRGRARRLEKDALLDAALVGNDVYNEERARVIDATDEVQVGWVFGFEAVVEQRSFFNQAQWSFQRALPVRMSRIALELPSAWTVETRFFNHEAVEPTSSGSRHVWELRDLPFLDDEPAAPELSSLAPRLAVSYAPPGSSSSAPLSFHDWRDVAVWASAISDPRSDPDEAVSNKARELTQGAADEAQRLEAIARFVQGVPYISIQVGLGRFQPHAATQVLAKQYGDCKDKAALMRALLKAVGIDSYLLLVSASDRSYVRREWASPMQFDHAIVAVAAPDREASPAAIRHPTLGTLLIFDPTDEHTRLGDLPQAEQGSLGLLAAGEAGTLIDLPVIGSERSRLVRETRAHLSESGQLEGAIVERSSGQAAVRERRIWKGRSRQQYVKLIEGWRAQGMVGARAERVEATDDAQGDFKLEVGFAADSYGQLMQGRLLVFKPALVGRRDSVYLSDKTRQHPVELEGRAATATTRIALPAGFVVDETPSAVDLETPFGSYRMTIAVEGEEIVLRREVETRTVILPVEEYPQVRSFFEQIMRAEQAPVVLVKE